MMESAKDFEEVQTGLNKQIDQEILGLKEYLKDIQPDDLKDSEKTGEIVERIFYASEGLKRLACVLGFMDCWEDNGQPPQISIDSKWMTK